MEAASDEISTSLESLVVASPSLPLSSPKPILRVANFVTLGTLTTDFSAAVAFLTTGAGMRPPSLFFRSGATRVAGLPGGGGDLVAAQSDDDDDEEEEGAGGGGIV